MKNDVMLQWALRYAALGWCVFPCDETKRPVKIGGVNPKTQEPYRLAWSRYATCVSSEVKALWAKYPQSNIGLACKKSGLVVIDIDCKDGAQGYESWEKLKECFGVDTLDTRNCPAQVTPSTGTHIIYSAERCEDLGNSSTPLGPGLDIRGGGNSNGGYIVLTPSKTPSGCYRWTETNSIFDKHIKLQPFPQVLADLLRAQKQTPVPQRQGVTLKPRAGDDGERLRGVVLRVATAKEHERNSVLYWGACRLGEMVKDGKLDMTAALDCLVAAAVDCGLHIDKNCGPNQITATIASGFRRVGVLL